MPARIGIQRHGL